MAREYSIFAGWRDYPERQPQGVHPLGLSRKELPNYILLVANNGPKFHESQTEGESSVEPDKNRMVIVVHRTPVPQLTEMLSNVLRAPVLDETGLKGRYDITIDAAKYIPTDRSDIPPDPLSIITTGLQQELGLRLESRRTTLDFPIIDHAEKAPTEN
jgi:uncharacterized protein (TIGR03435 family)